MKKPSVPKSLEGLEELNQLFSSFLRGASRPKSPRDTGIPAASFMLELDPLVKVKTYRVHALHLFANLLRPIRRRLYVSGKTRPDGQLTPRRILYPEPA